MPMRSRSRPPLSALALLAAACAGPRTMPPPPPEDWHARVEDTVPPAEPVIPVAEAVAEPQPEEPPLEHLPAPPPEPVPEPEPEVEVALPPDPEPAVEAVPIQAAAPIEVEESPPEVAEPALPEPEVEAPPVLPVELCALTGRAVIGADGVELGGVAEAIVDFAAGRAVAVHLSSTVDLPGAELAFSALAWPDPGAGAEEPLRALSAPTLLESGHTGDPLLEQVEGRARESLTGVVEGLEEEPQGEPVVARLRTAENHLLRVSLAPADHLAREGVAVKPGVELALQGVPTRDARGRLWVACALSTAGGAEILLRDADGAALWLDAATRAVPAPAPPLASTADLLVVRVLDAGGASRELVEVEVEPGTGAVRAVLLATGDGVLRVPWEEISASPDGRELQVVVPAREPGG
jgi:hypothetical protein